MNEDKNPETMSMNEIVAYTETLGMNYVRWKQVFDRYERGYKSKLAQLEKAIRSNVTEKMSETAIAREALASQAYDVYLQEWEKNEGGMLRARVKYETWQNYYEARKDLEATERKKMGLL